MRGYVVRRCENMCQKICVMRVYVARISDLQDTFAADGRRPLIVLLLEPMHRALSVCPHG